MKQHKHIRKQHKQIYNRDNYVLAIVYYTFLLEKGQKLVNSSNTLEWITTVKSKSEEIRNSDYSEVW